MASMVIIFPLFPDLDALWPLWVLLLIGVCIFFRVWIGIEDLIFKWKLWRRFDRDGNERH